jgi:hypothetical protein
MVCLFRGPLGVCVIEAGDAGFSLRGGLAMALPQFCDGGMGMMGIMRIMSGLP